MKTTLNQKIYATFDGGKGLSALCLELLSEQKKTWQDLRKGYESLQDIRERNIPYREFSVRLQYNRGRIKSSMADVSEKNVHPVRNFSGASNPAGIVRGPNPATERRSIISNRVNERRCFLCLDHLPEGQKGILHRNEYLILCNPMPVFSSHFTISHLDHRRQAIAENIDTLLHLIADFGSAWTILYNGPKCGASAPDHLHFQAAPSGLMPIEKEIRRKKRLTLMKQVNGALLYRVRDLGREVIILEGDDPMAVEDSFEALINGLKKVLLTQGPADEEPMMNIASFYKEKKWRLVIFPRRKHRPDAFFREGDARVVVSPGVIDMGGLLIAPVEKDFERLDADAVESIFREVSLEGETVQRAIGAMVW